VHTICDLPRQVIQIVRTILIHDHMWRSAVAITISSAAVMEVRPQLALHDLTELGTG